MSLFLHFSSTYIHQNMFYSYLYSEVFYWGGYSYIIHTSVLLLHLIFNGLFISSTYIQYIYILKDFIEGLVHIIWVLFILLNFIYLHLLISISNTIHLFLKTVFSKWVCFSTSAALTYTKFDSFIPFYIMQVFTERFVQTSFAWFFLLHYLFASVDFSYNAYL